MDPNYKKCILMQVVQKKVYVADAIVSILMEGGYYFYVAIPVYYLITGLR